MYIYIYKEMLFSHKKKEILIFTTTWKNMKDIILSEISQTKTNTYDLTHTWNLFLKKSQIHRNRNRLTDIENRLVVAKGRRAR